MPDADPRLPLVLVVDDDPRMLELVGVALRRDGFEVVQADDGDAVLRMVRKHDPDLVILDLKMRRVSGLEALATLRAAGESVAVIILTAFNNEPPTLAAFEAGADDYVTKPFLPSVLVARVRAVLRRARGVGNDDSRSAPLVERVGDVALDPRTHHVSVGQRSVALTPTEYVLLRTLMLGAGRVFTPTELLERVWGPPYAGQDEIVRANIYRLRHKLEPVPAEPRYIRGRRGVGYFFEAEPTVTQA